jgi:uncharacterized damage-inducible protein DinB
MTKQELLGRRDYFSMVHGVTMRAIASFTDEQLGWRPAPGMRSARELIFHIYTQEKVLATAARDRSFTSEAANAANPEDSANAAAVDALRTVRDAQTYADACHRTADEIFRAIPEADIRRPFDSPFGPQPPSQFFLFAYDEHWHHRGQLYTYLRLLGKQPPDLYGYS